MKKSRNLLMCLSFIVPLTITGCNQSEAEEESRRSLIQTTNPNPIQITNKKEGDMAERVKRDVMKFEEIYDVAVIQGKEDTLVVYKVKHLQRFRMNQIEANLTKDLENKYPDEKFTVSSDYKIFMEALELKEKARDPKYSSENAEKQLQKIIKLKEELT